MRSALALSALLLLLLPPPPSLAQNDQPLSTESWNDTTTAAKQDTSTQVTTVSNTSAVAVVDDTNLNNTAEPSPQTKPGADAGARETPTTGSSVPALAPNQTTDSGITVASPKASLAKDSLSMKNSTNSPPTVASTSPQVQTSTSVPTTLNTTSILDGLKTSSAPGTGEPATSSPVGVNSTTSTAPVLSAFTSHTSTGSVTPSSTSKDGDQRTVTYGGSTPTVGPTPVPSGPPSTLSTVPSDASPSHVPSSSLKPSVTETLTLSSGSPALETTRFTDIASSPEPVPSTGAPANWSAPFTSAAPHDIHPSPTSTAGSYKVYCDPPERFSEKLLVLNFTKPRPCVDSHFDDKLRTILCQAAKSTFNPAHDQCHIWLAPIPEIQALAVKKITIKTNLLPQDMYELMKDKWDALKEVGVSNMQLEGQGPPEEAEDRFSMPLIITIICMASFLLLVAALYGCCHQRLSQRKDQQRLTEELQTVENGYHDNPTLEVMETSSEMQEKKVVSLNGELGDSWIVPLDNLTKDDLDEEEDTHL